MLKKTARSILRLFPIKLQHELWGKRNKLLGKHTIKKWQASGKPVPPPHRIKQMIIERYKNDFNSSIFVETGTFLGTMVMAQKDNFSKIYSIELQDDLWKKADKQFETYDHIQILHGDSGKILEDIVHKLESRAIFWLDGHYSGGFTAKGAKECPIYEELNAILKKNELGHILLIDDARCFTGEGDYPTIAALEQYVKSRNGKYELQVKDDIIRFTTNQ